MPCLRDGGGANGIRHVEPRAVAALQLDVPSASGVPANMKRRGFLTLLAGDSIYYINPSTIRVLKLRPNAWMEE